MIYSKVPFRDHLPGQIKTIAKYILHCMDFDPFIVKSYSQEGEDLILGRMFEKESGFYVDVGAHHPRRFSNTFLLYKKGWRGINIDAMPKSMKAFRKQRPRDTNIEIPIAREQKILTYYQFNEPALNGFSEKLALSIKSPYKIISKKSMKTQPLRIVLENHISPEQEIDFLTIDVEGLDLEVLQSNDWNKFRPKVVLIEQLNSSMEQPSDSSVSTFLSSKGYHIYAKTFNTSFYISDSYLSILTA